MTHRKSPISDQTNREQDQTQVQPVVGAKVVIDSLIAQGVDVIFGYPGGAVLPLYDELFKQDKIRHILTRHEQAALHAAEGYARSTGKVGVCLVTSGPGLTNAVTGLTDAMMDSVPLVCLAGQVPTHLIGTDAFQEGDTTGITRCCTKHNYLVTDVDRLSNVVHEAFYIAREGRPGPVVIDIPKDVQQKTTTTLLEKEEVVHSTYKPRKEASLKEVKELVELLAQAKKPIFYTGGGVINSGTEASVRLKELAIELGVPVTSTLTGLGGFPASNDQFLGMLGMHGTYEANLSMYHSDLIIAVGARFDDRVTGRVAGFAPFSKKVHIDIDPSSFNKTVQVDLTVEGDVSAVLSQIQTVWKSGKKALDQAALKEWWAQIEKWRAVNCLDFTQEGDEIKPQYALSTLNKLTEGREDFYATTEVGQHQMWSAQYLKFDHPNRWMTSGGLGTMGYGFPAAVGVQIAHPDALVVAVAGEASFMMNIQELGTVAQYKLPLKVMIINNHRMGMVRQWQQLVHEERYSESYTKSLPNFVKLSDSFGLTGARVTSPTELEAAVKTMIESPGPYILEVVVSSDENCYPMIPSGADHNQIILGKGQKVEQPKNGGV